MSYTFARNNYSSYENTLSEFLKSSNPNPPFLQSNEVLSILGVDESYGRQYCKQIKEEFPEFVEAVKNGTYSKELSSYITLGQQNTFYSDDLQCMITPNSARYIYHAHVIALYIRTKFNTTALDVVELGGGYGGLCYWLRLLLPSIANYTIFDLHTAGKFQDHCLKQLNTVCLYKSNPYQFKKSNNPVFLISNYAYSAFNEYYQNLYKHTLLKQADAGFMIWNNWSGVYKFTERPMTIVPEKPEFSGIPNTFIYF